MQELSEAIRAEQRSDTTRCEAVSDGWPCELRINHEGPHRTANGETR